MLSTLWTTILILLRLPQIQSYSFIGNEIKDLETNDATGFANEILPWTLSGYRYSGVKHRVCDGTYILGGSDVLPIGENIMRTYSGLPNHNMIKFTIKFWLIDSLDPADFLRVVFDDITFEILHGSNYYGKYFLPNKCGGVAKDIPDVAFTGTVLHTGTTLKLTFISTLDQAPTDESFGIRDITLLFANKTSTDINSFCTRSAEYYPSMICECPTENPNPSKPITCVKCDPICSTCNWLDSTQCLSCRDGSYLSGGKCLPCHSFCSKCSSASVNQCSACNFPYYLINGQTCTSTCNAPLVMSNSSSSGRICSATCPPDQPYVGVDRTCVATCGEFTRSVLRNGLKLCEYYCTAPNFYSPLDYTCGTSCPVGYYGGLVDRYCRPCQDSLCATCPTLSGTKCDQCLSGAIMDIDGVCKICNAMIVEHIKSTLTGDKFKITLSPSTCSLAPSFVEANFIATDETKARLPPFSYTLQQRDEYSYFLEISFVTAVLEETSMKLRLDYLSGIAPISKKFVPSETLQAIAEAAPTTTAVLGGTVGATLIGAIAFGATAALWSLVSFQQFIGYFMFINIEYPFQVDLFFSILQSTSLDFLPNPLASVTEFLSEQYSGFKIDLDAEAYQPPKKFAKFEYTSFFIENGGSSISVTLFFLALAYIIPLILRIQVIKWKMIQFKIYLSLKWNIIFRTLLESGIPLMLAVFLQFRRISLSSLYCTLSALLAVFGFFYFIIMLQFIMDSLKNKKNSQLATELAKMKYGTLYDGMQLNKPYVKYYHVIILLRGVLLMFLITYLEEVPEMQVIPLIIYNIGLVYYLFTQAEFQDIKLSKINKIKEVLILIGESAILLLNIEGQYERYYETLGWIIVVTFLSALLVDLLYTLKLQLSEMKESIKKMIQYARLLLSKLRKKDKIKKFTLTKLRLSKAQPSKE